MGKARQRQPSRKTQTVQRTIRVLFTCVGRRVELLRAFKQAGEALAIPLETHGADATRLSPAWHRVDKPHLVSPIDAGRYIDDLLDIVRRRKIDLLIPLIDNELPLLADAREAFADLGCTALISSPEVIATCRCKLKTFAALTDAGIDTPQTWPWSEAVQRKRHRLPYFLKPRCGSAARGNYVVTTTDELRTFGQRVDDAIVQEFVEGAEHTLDVYTGFDGRPRCVVPRKRLEVRTGEVSKGLIVKDPEIMAVGARVAEALGECRGVVTVQCIVHADRPHPRHRDQPAVRRRRAAVDPRRRGFPQVDTVGTARAPPAHQPDRVPPTTSPCCATMTRSSYPTPRNDPWQA